MRILPLECESVSQNKSARLCESKESVRVRTEETSEPTFVGSQQVTHLVCEPRNTVGKMRFPSIVEHVQIRPIKNEKVKCNLPVSEN